MAIRVNNTLSKTCPIQGGSPQGTKLGNLLFCVAIDDIVIERGQIPPTEATPPDCPMSAIPDQYLPNAQSTPIPRMTELNDSFNPNPFGFRKKNIMRDSVLEDALPEVE